MTDSATGFKVGDLVLSRNATDAEWGDAGFRLLAEHDCRDMAVDGRPITNIEMHAVMKHRQSLECLIANFTEDLDAALEELKSEI